VLYAEKLWDIMDIPQVRYAMNAQNIIGAEWLNCFFGRIQDPQASMAFNRFSLLVIVHKIYP